MTETVFKINITILKSFRVIRCTKNKESKQYYEYWKEIFIKIYFFQVPNQKIFMFLRHHFQIAGFSRFFRFSGIPGFSNCFRRQKIQIYSANAIVMANIFKYLPKSEAAVQTSSLHNS